MTKSTVKILITLSVFILFFANITNVKASTSAFRDVFWTKGEVKDWETLNEENGEGGTDKYKRAIINSEQSSVQVLVYYLGYGNYRVGWGLNIYLDKGYDSNFISIWYGDRGAIFEFWEDTKDDGIFSYHFDVEPNTGPYGYEDQEDKPKREVDDVAIYSYGNFSSEENEGSEDDHDGFVKSVEFMKLEEISTGVYELGVFYELNDLIFKNFTSKWTIYFTDKTTSVKIYTDYRFHEDWGALNDSFNEEFFMVEPLDYLYTTPDNFIPQGQGHYYGDKVTTYAVDESYEMTTMNGKTFGTIEIPQTFNAVYLSSGAYTEEKKQLVGCVDDQYHYDIAYNTISRGYNLCLNNLTSTPTRQLVRVYYDPEFSFEHDIKTVEFFITTAVLIGIIIGISVASVVIVHRSSPYGQATSKHSDLKDTSEGDKIEKA